MLHESHDAFDFLSRFFLMLFHNKLRFRQCIALFSYTLKKKNQATRLIEDCPELGVSLGVVSSLNYLLLINLSQPSSSVRELVT